jgi:hypothetical protein
MLRRNLIAAAGASLVLPAARVAQAAYCSNPPIGRFEVEQAYGDCDPALVENWPVGYMENVNTLSSGIVFGRSPFPRTPIPVRNLNDLAVRAGLTPGQYMDFQDLLNGATGGVAAAELSRVGSGRFAFSNGYGVGAALGFWIGYQAGTFLYQSGAAVQNWLFNTSMAQFMRDFMGVHQTGFGTNGSPTWGGGSWGMFIELY